ncbi:GGDEF domain-containing protein [Nitrospirillum sp. BR 11828]|uniref:GGDEF domain-containing protein n=1 Tax=Nitrospirillum sp. BR 11828 TaxID=3104325 RepID=UPI002ACA606E|nr:GGDEF domain-containing protein [Nitrospirillum sp. BR 11828]MDZ5648311.1 GGDEF domain-containing protein [Nitrospirillum sp. BR 11828]
MGHHIKQVVWPDRAYVDDKFDHHRLFSTIMTVATSVTVSGLWGWDYVIDAEGAQRTIGLRLLMSLIILLHALLLHFRVSRRLTTAYAFLGAFTCQMLFIEVLNRLDHGMQAQFSGFLFFTFLPLLVMQYVPFTTGALFMVLIIALPPVAGVVGFAHGFEYVKYPLLLGPVGAMFICVLFAFEQINYTNYENQRLLRLVAITDSLTGAGTRRHITETAAREMVRARRYGGPLSVLMLDIDHFKRINDTWGHQAGDQAILAVVELCRATIRETDVIGRFGGEEFVIVLPQTGRGEAERVAERLRAAVAATPVALTPDVSVTLTCSLGVTELADDDETVDGLLARADEALYAAKNAGRNRVAVAA